MWVLDVFLFLEKPIDNTRYSKTTFHMKTGNLIHGIAGYFDAVLYDDVSISKCNAYVPGIRHRKLV